MNYILTELLIFRHILQSRILAGCLFVSRARTGIAERGQTETRHWSEWRLQERRTEEGRRFSRGKLWQEKQRGGGEINTTQSWNWILTSMFVRPAREDDDLGFLRATHSNAAHSNATTNTATACYRILHVCVHFSSTVTQSIAVATRIFFSPIVDCLQWEIAFRDRRLTEVHT